eukprot:4271655-Prymnesium_polylepis.2
MHSYQLGVANEASLDEGRHEKLARRVCVTTHTEGDKWREDDCRIGVARDERRQQLSIDRAPCEHKRCLTCDEAQRAPQRPLGRNCGPHTLAGIVRVRVWGAQRTESSKCQQMTKKSRRHETRASLAFIVTPVGIGTGVEEHQGRCVGFIKSRSQERSLPRPVRLFNGRATFDQKLKAASLVVCCRHKSGRSCLRIRSFE